MNWTVLIADAEDIDFLAYWRKPGSMVFELLTVFGILLLLVLIIFAWAAFLRAPKRRRHAYGRNQTTSEGSSGSSSHRRRRRRRHGPLRAFRVMSRIIRGRRKRRRRGRSVNPTLAQVGGLPPSREEHPRAS